MVTKEKYLSLPGPARYVLFLIAFEREGVTKKEVCRFAGGQKAGIRTEQDAQAALACLKGQELLHVDGRSRRYGLAQQFAHEAAQEMMRQADERAWWPAASDWEQTLGGVGRGYRTIGDREQARRICAMAELVRMAVCGETEPPSDSWLMRTKPEASDALEIGRAAALLAFSRFEAISSAFARAETPFAEMFLAAFLNLAFMHGEDVLPLLEVLAGRFAEAGTKPASALGENFLAHAVWCAHADWLDLPGLASFASLRTACKTLLSGQATEADKLLRRMFDEFAPARTLDGLPVRFLMLLACCSAKPEKLPKSRPVQILRGNNLVQNSYRCRTWAFAYVDWVCGVNVDLGETWKSLSSGARCIVPKEDEPPRELRAGLLLPAWSWQRYAGARTALKNRAHRLVAPFVTMAQNGYLNLAGLGLSLLTGCYADDEVAEVLAEMEARGTWLQKRVPPPPEWETALGLLRTALDKAGQSAAKHTKKDGRRLRWGVTFERPDEKGNLAVVAIRPYLRKDGCKPGGTNEIALPLDDCTQEKWRAFFTEADNRLLVQLRANTSGYYYDSTWINEAVLEALCDLPNLELRRQSWYGGRSAGPEEGSPISFERGTCQLASKMLEGGGLDFALPPWVLGVSRKYVVRRKKKDGNVYLFIPISSDLAKVVEVFERAGDQGRLVFPPESLSSASDVFERLTSLIPLAQPSAEDVAALPRVPARSDVTVRLDYDGGTRLVVQGVVTPVADNAGMVFEPGSGLPEKVVAGVAGSYLLVRDLAAEKAAFARVAEALAACEDWFDGRSTWTIEDLPSAIEALASLKALDPAVPFEWIDQRRLEVAYAPKSGVALESARTAEQWFSVKGTFTLDTGRVLGVLELLAALPGRAGRYVKLSDGAFVALTRSMVREMEALAAVGRRKGGALEVPRAALPMLDKAFDADDAEGVALPAALAKSADEIRALLARRPSIPKLLQADLRSYQEDGYRWLSRLASCGFGACLADDMGLGKTLQIIALLLERAQDGASLVVAPASVCGNWRREIQRFAPTLNPLLAFECADAGTSAGPGDVVITSYGYLLFHEDTFVARAWNGVVLDEAQAIKNDASKRAHAVKRFDARFRVAATGTPVENRLGELWSLFDFLNPGLLGPAASFAQRFIVEGKAKPELKKLVKPLILRRLKGDVLEDLPEKTEISLSVNLGAAERSAYEGCRLHALAALEGKDEGDRISILAELTRLRRFCCHPSLVLGASDVPSAKMEVLVDLLGELHDGHHRALVFSQFTDYLALVRQIVQAHGWTCKYLDGSTPTLERERLVNDFQAGEGDFFLISLKAGGTGLNLTAANYVILLDPWWNPAVENQAADRAHRIGQTQPVTIYRLVAADTVEERVIELHKEKNAMAADLLEGTSSTSFTSKDLLKLFQ